MSRKAPTRPPADAIKPEPPPAPPPKPGIACHKCGTVLEGERDKYWHARGDSAGCIRAAMGMILDLHGRLEVIEGVFKRVANSVEAPAPAAADNEQETTA